MFKPPWYDTDCDRLWREKEKWRNKANSDNGIEADYDKFRSFRKDLKNLMDLKNIVNVIDDDDTCLISKKIWSEVQAKTKPTRIPETIWHDKYFRTKPIDQAKMINQFFYDQFSEKSKYDIDIDINITSDQFNDIVYI